MDCSSPGFPVHHQSLELIQTHVHWVSDAIQRSHPLLSPSIHAVNLSHHQGLFQWVSSSHQVAKVLEFQLPHQSFQWIFRTNFLLDWLVGSSCHPNDSQDSSPTPQFKSTPVRTVLILKSTNNKCWKGCGEKGTLFHCWWEYKLIQPLWKTVWRFLKKLGIKPPCDPAMPLLGIYPEETKTERDTCIPLFIAVLFTIAKTRKQPICPLTDEWIKKLWYTYLMEYYSAIKKH